MAAIVRDEAIRSGDPRIDGTRVTVLDLKRRVIDNEEDPHVVAGEYEISPADLFRALTYYYEHRPELQQRERERDAARSDGELRTSKLLSEVEGENAGTTEQAD